MFRKLPRYKDLRAAGDWLERIPSHWGWDPARTLFVERKQTGFDSEPLLSVTIGRGVIPQADLLSTTSKKDSSNTDKSKYKLVISGDLVYNKMRAWQGAAGLSQHHGIVSPAYVVMTPRRGDAAYFHYIVRTAMFAKEAERWSYGITSDQWSLRPEHFKMIRFPVPPLEEQAAIVKYLAHANARIDKAIAAKRRLIALLQEQAQAEAEALIDHAAVDASEPLLGRALRRIEQGTSPSAAEGDLAEDQWAVLSLSAVNRGLFVPMALKPVDPEFVVAPTLELHDGDLLMTRSNTRERVGDVAVVDGVRPKTFMSDLIYRLVLRDDLITADFASILLRTRRVRMQIEGAARGSSDSMPKLTQGHIKGLRVSLPSLGAQKGAVATLHALTAPIRAAEARTAREVVLLQEFRTRLVADVVTGQVDVRDIARSLPDINAASRAPDVSGGVGDVTTDEVMEMSEV